VSGVGIAISGSESGGRLSVLELRGGLSCGGLRCGGLRCGGLIGWERSALLRFGGTGEAPVATWVVALPCLL
jgi:hypothetical protein